MDDGIRATGNTFEVTGCEVHPDAKDAVIARLTAELAESQERERVLRNHIEYAINRLEYGLEDKALNELHTGLRAALGEP